MWSTFRPAVAGALRAGRGASTANRWTFAVSRAHVLRTTPTGYVFNKQVRYLAAAAQGQAKATKSAGTKKTPAKIAPAKKASGTTKVAAKKKKPVVKKKVVKKPKKVVKKVAKKVVKKPKKVVVKTPEQKKRALIKDLKITSLILEQPKQLPTSAWRLFFIQNVRAGSPVPAQTKELSVQYKALSAAELQALTEIADKNRAANAARRKAWVETRTPLETTAANRARNHLKRLKVKGNFPRLADERIPTRPLQPYMFYTIARRGSGELEGSVLDQAKVIGQEWNNLSAVERKPYEDLARNEAEKYQKHQAALGINTAASPA